MLGAAREAACGGHAKRRDFPRIRATPASLASRAETTNRSTRRWTRALRETETAGPLTARRSAPHAKARGAVTPRGETSLARYNNHRFALRRQLALRDGCGLRPGLTTTAARLGGSLRPHTLRVARDRNSRSAHGPALGTPREGAWRGHAKGRDFPRSIQQPPLRASPTARAPRRLRPAAWPDNHRCAPRRLAPPAHAPRCARQKQPVRSRPGARHPTRRRVARSRQGARLPSLDTTTTASRFADSSRSATAAACGLA